MIGSQCSWLNAVKQHVAGPDTSSTHACCIAGIEHDAEYGEGAKAGQGYGRAKRAGRAVAAATHHRARLVQGVVLVRRL